uniref:Late embryogenesis abundant protein LEA-2 subgroup domain-containing protein n=1 Tax=Davidia involucrata TaxID=16924 RepID=A0A5B7AYR1_DAVIN
MTVKHCGHYHNERRKLYRRLFAGFLTLIVIVLFIILLVWLILRPTKPRFILQDATVYAFNVSSPNFLTSNLQITMASRNPNARIGIYYDSLDIYATYQSQQITLPTVLPSTYQGHKDYNIWSPFLYGNAIPMAPYLAVALNQDQMAGMVLINIKVDGRVRWKVGTFISGRYHLHVNCPAYITFGNNNNGIAVGPATKYQLVQHCYVDV